MTDPAEKESQQLSQLEQVFRQPDAVMESNIFETLCQYVAAHGKPRTAIEILCENYVGYAHMGALMCDWLAATEPHVSQTAGTSGGEKQQQQRRAGRGRTKQQQQPGQQVDQSASHFLREVVVDKFDPNCFGSVFGARSSGQLAWLDDLKTDSEGRALIYKLSTSHRSCLVLNFAIQKILHAGYEDEVARVGSSLAGYFGVFHRLLASRLKQVPAAKAAQLAAITVELRDSCCGAEHSYVHAQQLLAALERHPNGANFRRLAQELDHFAAAPLQGGPEVWRLTTWLRPPQHITAVETTAHEEALQLVADFAAAAQGAEAQQQRLFRLQEIFTVDDPPLIAPLQQPQVLSRLTSILFAARAPSAEVITAAAAVAAVAVAAIDDRPAGGHLDAQDIAETAAALRAGVQLAQNVLSGTKMDPAQQLVAEAVLAVPVVAMGVLGFISAWTERSSYWRETYRVLAAPAVLALLATIISHHPSMHSQAMNTIAAALIAVENSHPDIVRLLLDIAVAILQSGQVEVVLAALEKQWIRSADPSHARFFIFQVLKECAPPYSPYFATTMLSWMARSGVRRSYNQRDNAPQQRLLEEFAQACLESEPALQLPPHEQAFLGGIASNLQ